ncbi:MAG: hypothetical protein HZC55_15230 [Verrucomicrobia bacterium]|nr:hypothetical protein [Verrucomicrobiota bacterium]
MPDPHPPEPDQPVPAATLAEVDRIARREFPGERAADALSLLEAYGSQPWHREIPRVRLAVLKLAGGNLEKLRRSLATANQDYRDALAAAEYPTYLAKVFPGDPDSARRSGAIAADWQQYRAWLDRK